MFLGGWQLGKVGSPAGRLLGWPANGLAERGLVDLWVAGSRDGRQASWQVFGMAGKWAAGQGAGG
jgi:hypothetical protein